jgi:uncharacterized protein
MSVENSRNLLRLNVGFIIHEQVGYSREFPFDIPSIHLQPDLDLTNLTGTARVTRTGQGLLLQVKMRSSITAECVRCLKDFDQPLSVDFTELYAFTKDQVTESGLLVPETGKIDLASLLREEFLLAIPISPLCKVDCPGLCPVCGEDLNEGDHDHADELIDPRLEALKALLEKKEPPSAEA